MRVEKMQFAKKAFRSVKSSSDIVNLGAKTSKNLTMGNEELFNWCREQIKSDKKCISRCVKFQKTQTSVAKMLGFKIDELFSRFSELKNDAHSPAIPKNA